MEGFVISILITFVFVLFSCWNSESRRLQKILKERADLIDECFQLARGVRLIHEERFKDFAVRWGVSDSWIEMAFITFKLGNEDNFRYWTREEFLLWFQTKREAEGLFEANSTSTIDPRLGAEIDRYLSSLPDLPE